MSTRREVFVVCDMCGTEQKTHMDMASTARAHVTQTLGWSHPSFATDHCPRCKNAFTEVPF